MGPDLSGILMMTGALVDGLGSSVGLVRLSRMSAAILLMQQVNQKPQHKIRIIEIASPKYIAR